MALALKIEELSKAYRLGQFNTGALSQDLKRWWALARGKEDPFLKIGEANNRQVASDSSVVWSLKDINLDIEQGDTFGVVGKNGAGKSTLLKVLSRVTSPTQGSFKLRGRVASLLEVGTGFHPELTGRENIFLNGAILGMRKREIQVKFDEIVDFAGVARYVDTPVKRYSSGMYVRLAFAVAAHLESEILIVDEVLAVGDQEFQKKCVGKMGEVSRGQGRTVLFVSHNMASVKRLCKHGILLNRGTVKTIGNIDAVINDYLNEGAVGSTYTNDETDGALVIRKMWIEDELGEGRNDFRYDEGFSIRFSIDVTNFREGSSIFVMVLDQNKRRVFPAETPVNRNKTEYSLHISPVCLTRGSFSLHAFTHVPGQEMLNEVEDACQFTIVDHRSPLSIHGDYDYGVVFGDYKWS